MLEHPHILGALERTSRGLGPMSKLTRWPSANTVPLPGERGDVHEHIGHCHPRGTIKPKLRDSFQHFTVPCSVARNREPQPLDRKARRG